MLKEYVKYYYGALPDDKKKVYKLIYNAIKDTEREVLIPGSFSIEEIHEVAWAVYNDTPSFFYYDPYKTTYYTPGSGKLLQLDYLYGADRIQHYNEWLSNGLEAFERKYMKPGMSEYQKELVIHDYLTRTITYDSETLLPENDGKIAEAYNVLGALLKKKAVCWGIALAFKLLCDYCRVKNFVVIGRASEEKGEDNHAWNIVKIDNEEYHVDVTWDIKEKGDISFCYDYFNLSDRMIKFNHSWQSSLYPTCHSETLNYYRLNKLYVKSPEQIPDYVAEQIRQGHQRIAVKYAARDMPGEPEIMEQLQKGVYDKAGKTSFRCFISPKTYNIYLEIES